MSWEDQMEHRRPRSRTFGAVRPLPNSASTGPARRRSEAGSSMVEFAMLMAFWVPLFLAMVVAGVALGKSINANQVTRDIGILYAKELDFSTGTYKALPGRLMSDFNFSDTGDSVLILSKVVKAFDNDCAAASLPNGCTNSGKYVIVSRLYIGNKSVRSSNYANPRETCPPNPSNNKSHSCMQANGTIAGGDYMSLTDFRAQGFEQVKTLAQGQVAYLIEGGFKSATLSALSTPMGGNYSGELYATYVF